MNTQEFEDDVTIWAMCPYCEEEVEFYDLRDQQCPYCGLHFTPAQDSYYEDVEEDSCLCCKGRLYYR